MQVLASYSEFEIVSPRAIAARAIAEPTIARMSAYSAAEAPESSRSMLMKYFTLRSFPQKEPAVFRRELTGSDSEESGDANAAGADPLRNGDLSTCQVPPRPPGCFKGCSEVNDLSTCGLNGS